MNKFGSQLCKDRKKKRAIFTTTLLLVLLTLGISLANAGTTYVPADYETIQEAINAADEGEIILVSAGTYNELITFDGTKRITVRTYENAIINGDIDGDGTGDGSVLTFRGDNSTLDGFTITNGSGTYDARGFSNGGGIFCRNSSPTIINCTINGNEVMGSFPGGGGGIWLQSSAPTITDCIITNNKAPYGGGIFAYNSGPLFISSPIITNCIISGNEAIGTYADGGGILSFNTSPSLTSSLSIANCIISGNKADDSGGGIYYFFISSSPTITNCTISGNLASSGGGIYSGNSSSPVVVNSILWRNSTNEIFLDESGNSSITINFSDIEGSWAGDGNIDADPMFVEPRLASEAPTTESDYHIQSDSPCVDAGTSLGAPSEDIDGNSRPQGAGYDLGADEYNSDPVHVGPGQEYTTIQSAVNAASDGDVVLVHEGVYNELITFNGMKTIFVQSECGPDCTTIDGSGLEGSVVSFRNGDSSTLEGFKITNGSGNYIDYFQLNFGGGIYMDSSSPTIVDCKIINNISSADGGGVFCFKSSPTFTKCVISGNEAAYSGGAVFGCYLSPITLTNCVITGNTAMNGAGLWFSASSPTITNCTISGNSAVYYAGGILSYYSSSPTVVNSILWGNTAGTDGDEVYIYDNTSSITVSYSNIDPSLINGPGTPCLSNNINADPSFVDQRPNSEAPTSAGDYHLKASSPCIDAVTCNESAITCNEVIYTSIPTDDIDDDKRPQGTGCDIGADEYICENAFVWYKDADGDLYSDGTIQTQCTDPGDDYYLSSDLISTSGDCDDTNVNTYLGATEICDGLDNDCDGVVPTDEADSDNDGMRVCDGDCDDINANTYPDATEICDGLDNDCDGVVPTDEADGDNDGMRVCDGDCDDINANTYPGATEICDGLDNDCDGVVPTDEADSDNDGMRVCDGDCDDTNVNTYLGATEICDGLDNDCDGVVPTDEADSDNDGMRICDGDCDDTNISVNPGVAEICHNGIDDNCDGQQSEGCAPNSVPLEVCFSNCSYSTIQAAIDDAVNGDTILVHGGVYNELIILDGSKTITVRTEEGAMINGDTDGDDSGNGSVVTFTGGDNSTLEGFTITQGTGTYNDYFQLNFGGGLYMDSSSPSIIDCDIINNSVDADGGGVYCFQSSPTFVRCIISGNQAAYSGGGVFGCYLSPLTLTNCEITGNKAMNGAALWFSASSPTITNCTISGNSAVYYAGGILSYYSSSPTVVNSILWGNTAGTDGDEVYIYDNTSSITISYSNIDPSLINGPGIPYLSNNINADPSFVDQRPASEAPTSAGDYHLKASSPCINIGTSDQTTYTNLPSDDLDGDSRPEGAEYDMGSDEFVYNILHVGPGQTYSTIQSAIDATDNGDVVLVHDETYVENIYFRGKAITVRSKNGAHYTTIDGAGSGSVIAFRDGDSSTIDGFTLTNGSGNDISGNKWTYGGGIVIYGSSSPTIRNCVIKDNSAYIGGGISCLNASASIINCSLTDNTTQNHGSGIYSAYSDVNITNCLIANNHADFHGAVASHGDSFVRVVNSTIADNSVNQGHYGGGIDCRSTASVEVINSILWANTPDQIHLAENGSVTVHYSDIQGGWTGTRNIDDDPSFDATYQLTTDSPCIDTGTSTGAPSGDIVGNNRPQDGKAGTQSDDGQEYDMGAYEYGQ